MSDFLRLLVIFIAAVNPPAVALAMADKGGDADARPAWQVPLIGGCVAAALLVLAVLVSESLLDWLQIAPESFRVAAGIVMAVAGLAVIWRGRWSDGGHNAGIEAAIFPLALPLLAGPAALVAAISYGVDEGRGETIAAALIAVALAALLVATKPAKGRPALDASARILGALLVAVAAGLVVSGVRAI